MEKKKMNKPIEYVQIQTAARRTHNAGNGRQPQRQGGNNDKDEDREGKLYACGLQ